MAVILEEDGIPRAVAISRTARCEPDDSRVVGPPKRGHARSATEPCRERNDQAIPLRSLLPVAGGTATVMTTAARGVPARLTSHAVRIGRVASRIF
jgi:hypothetical protein